MKHVLDRVEAVFVERGALGRETDVARRGLHRASVDLGHQVGHVVRFEVDHVQAQRLVHAHTDALAYRVLGPLDVSPAGAGDVGDVRNGVVLGLEPQVALDVPAARVDRMCRPDVRCRSHRRDVTGHRDERARRRGARSRRRDERDDRHPRGEEARGDVIRRIDQPTRGVDDEDHRRRTVPLSLGDHAVDIAGGDRIDHTIDLSDENGRPPCRERASRQPERSEHDRQRGRRSDREAKPAHSTILDPP